jgi:hypothetical protein
VPPRGRLRAARGRRRRFRGTSRRGSGRRRRSATARGCAPRRLDGDVAPRCGCWAQGTGAPRNCVPPRVAVDASVPAPAAVVPPRRRSRPMR